MKLCIGLAALLLLCSCESSKESNPPSYSDISADRLQQIKSAGIFKVAVCPGNPPFAFKDSNGQLSGIEIDIINAIGRELKLTPQFFEVQRDNASGLLRDGTSDILCGSFDGPSISRQFLIPAIEYLPSGQRAVIRSDAVTSINDPKQLNSDKITLITVLGSTGSKISPSLFPNAKSMNVPSFEKGIEELKSAENRVFLVDNAELLKRDGLSSDPQVKVVFGFLSSERLAMGVRRGDVNWKALLESGFRRIMQSGEVGRITGRHFPSISAGSIDIKDASSGPSADLKLDFSK